MNVFFSAVLKLAGMKLYWLPSRMARLVWGVSTNFPRQVEMYHVLNNSVFAGTISGDPLFPFRYLNQNYLTCKLTVTERASSFLHHYSRLNTLLSAPLLLQILHRDFTLLEIREGGDLYRIAMELSRSIYTEGELSLNLEVNGTAVFVLSFTIVPGRVVGLEVPDVLMITRLQGVRGSQRQIRDVTKALHEVAPNALLVAAIQGIAKAFGIANLAGICAADHANYSDADSTSFEEAYDDFWGELGATKNAANFFLCSIPPKEKPLVLIRNGHKARTRKKRKFKQEIAEAVCQRLHEGCRVAPSDSTSLFAREYFGSRLAIIPEHAVDSSTEVEAARNSAALSERILSEVE
jgi:uncharacterized protein VirK/YbjX